MIFYVRDSQKEHRTRANETKQFLLKYLIATQSAEIYVFKNSEHLINVSFYYYHLGVGQLILPGISNNVQPCHIQH